MKIYDLNGKLENVDVRQSSYPMRGNASKSKLQRLVGQRLLELYPNEIILEEWFLPNSRLSVDFFIVKLGIIIEINGHQHSSYVPYFHGDRKTSTKYAGQIKRDMAKVKFCEINNFDLIEIWSEKDVEEKLNANNR